MLKVASGELTNEISVLINSLTDTNREHHIFPKHICQRILLKVKSILIPSLESIPLPITNPTPEGYIDKATTKVLASIHPLRQNLILIKGNVENAENQFHTDSLLFIVKELDYYFPDKIDYIIDSLRIARDNSEAILRTTTEQLRFYDKSMLQTI